MLRRRPASVADGVCQAGRVKVVGVEELSTLRPQEAELLDKLLADHPGEFPAADLVVYLTQYTLTPAERAMVSVSEAGQIEEVKKVVAPRNPRITVGGYAYDASVFTASSQAVKQPEDGSVQCVAELEITRHLIAADAEGEFLEPPPAEWVEAHSDD